MKKCMPRKFSGAFMAVARSSIEIEEVFEADPRARAEYDAVCDAWKNEAIIMQDALAESTVFIDGVAVWKILEKSA